MLSEAEVERVCFRTAEILAPDTALPPTVIQSAVRLALEEVLVSNAASAAAPAQPHSHASPQEEQPAGGNAMGLPAYPATPNLAQPHNGHRNLELVFVHDCRNHGCNLASCVLCKHNPAKRCTGNFAHKYWVGDKLLAKCEGSIVVEVIDADTGERMVDEVQGMRIEVCILDGNKYTSRCREAGEQRLEILDECEVMRNQRNEPLLVAGNANNDAENPQVVLKFPPGVSSVSLRDMKVTESSESVLAGTKRPPFRLVCRALSATGARLPIRPVVSEEFVVVTKRTKNLKKQEIPSLDDPISKLNHIGKETVKKLNELKASADEAQLQLPIPPELYRITKVREFQALARLSEADGHLQQRIKQLLKLSKEKWDAACDHAKTAVQVDNRMRAWYQKNMAVGLLYTCSLGEVRPDCPVALIQNNADKDGDDAMKVIPCEHQLPQQRKQVNEVADAATRCWWDEQHPGWMIFTLGNRHFETLDQIVQFSQGAEVDAGNGMGPDASLENAMSDMGRVQHHDDAENGGLPLQGEWSRTDGAARGKLEAGGTGHNMDLYNPMSLFRHYMRYRPGNPPGGPLGRNGHTDEPKQRAGPGQGQEQEPEQERNPFQFMTQRPFGDGGLPLPASDAASIMAALNWQALNSSAMDTSSGLPIQAGNMLSGGGSLLCNGSLSSLNLSGLPSLPSTTSMGRRPGPEIDRAPTPPGPPLDAGDSGEDMQPRKRPKMEEAEDDLPSSQSTV
ncbi:g8546 [Coccomyxa elongata]